MEQDLAAARQALGKLAPTPEARAAKAHSEREKAYLGAVEILFGSGDKEERDRAYASAMAEVHRGFPDDVDGTAFYALALLGTCHAGRDLPTYMQAAGLLEEVYRTHPTHPGVLHYLIHCYDDPVHAPLGLRMARAYGSVAPQAPHAVHMTSHIFLALGMWDETVVANERAVAATNQARVAHGLKPLSCGHYFSWLAYGELEQGRLGSAQQLTEACGEQARQSGPHGAHGHGGADSSPAASFATMRAHYLLITNDWNNPLAQSFDPGDAVGARVITAFVAGYRAIEQHDLAAARTAAQELDAAKTTIDQSFAKEPEADTAPKNRAAILDLELQALLENAEGHPDAAVVTLRKATTIEEQLPFAFGPPAVEKPSHELLGEMLAAQGHPVEAATAFRSALARAPRRTTSLHGLALAEAASGHREEAERISSELRAIEHQAGSAPRRQR